MSDSPIDYLLSRRSVKFVEEPGPSEDDLALIFQAAMRAPDHGKLRPWRFALVRGEAIGGLAELVVSCAKAADTPMAAEKEASNGSWRERVTLVIGVEGGSEKGKQRKHEHERMLDTGAAEVKREKAEEKRG